MEASCGAKRVAGGGREGNTAGNATRSCPAELVAVADFCIDRFKGSVWDSDRCDGSGTAFGVSTDDYPDSFSSSFPDSGDWTQTVYACSLEGVVPAGDLTWFQADQSCAAVGKSLCTNAQWQTAVAGYPAVSSQCQLDSESAGQTGALPTCTGPWGTVDQVGIRWEWVADWVAGGLTWIPADHADDGFQQPWPVGYGDDQDYTLNVNGTAMDSLGQMTAGLPAAIIRGGDFGSLETAGPSRCPWRAAPPTPRPSSASAAAGPADDRRPGPTQPEGAGDASDRNAGSSLALVAGAMTTAPDHVRVLAYLSGVVAPVACLCSRQGAGMPPSQPVRSTLTRCQPRR